MSTLKSLMKASRLFQCIIASLTVLAIARFATRQQELSTTVIAAAISMALLVVASSLYHYAYQNHSQPFTRRTNDYADEQHAVLFGNLAGLGFLATIFISAIYLPATATVAILLAELAIMAYTQYGGTHAPLNTLIAAICMVPVYVGWTASDVPVSWVTFILMAAAFTLYYVREVFKDSQETLEIQKKCESELDRVMMVFAFPFALTGALPLAFKYAPGGEANVGHLLYGIPCITLLGFITYPMFGPKRPFWNAQSNITIVVLIYLSLLSFSRVEIQLI